ncbi:MAG: SPFH/Band 7/PHB domain protein [Armatimonadetes bacterium]|nr:SPFH/Band 7/PHB domain protein [Armatimonadota bacterium]
MEGPTIFGVVVLAILVMVVIGKSLCVVRQYQRGLIETFRKYSRTAQPGLTIVFPFVQSITFVDMRETVLDVAPQTVITSDNATLTVDAVIYFEVTDPVRNVYNVTDFRMAAIKLAQTNLRNILGEMKIDEALTSRERINAQLRQIMDDATDKWGVRVTRVELQSIEPPRDITEAMSRQMKAERDKRAAILEAEGVKQAQILAAEGERQARINRAEGEAEAIKKVAEAEKFRQLTVAEGEAQAIETVFGAIHTGKPTSDLLAVKYLEALGRIANGKATKVFLPIEATGILGAMAGIGDAFKEGQTPIAPEE